MAKPLESPMAFFYSPNWEKKRCILSKGKELSVRRKSDAVIHTDEAKSPINSEASELSMHGETGSIQMFNCVIGTLNVHQPEAE